MLASTSRRAGRRRASTARPALHVKPNRRHIASARPAASQLRQARRRAPLASPASTRETAEQVLASIVRQGHTVKKVQQYTCHARLAPTVASMAPPLNSTAPIVLQATSASRAPSIRQDATLERTLQVAIAFARAARPARSRSLGPPPAAWTCPPASSRLLVQRARLPAVLAPSLRLQAEAAAVNALQDHTSRRAGRRAAHPAQKPTTASQARPHRGPAQLARTAPQKAQHRRASASLVPLVPRA